MQAVLPPEADLSVLDEREGFGLRLGSPHLSIQNLFNLAGRTVIITGASGSIGANIASAVLQSGADAILIDKEPQYPRSHWETLQSIAEAYSTKVHYEVCDVSVASNIEVAFLKSATAARWSLGGLVVCAGIPLNAPALDTSMVDLQRVFGVNVHGTFICCRETVKIMRSQGVKSGSIVVLASMSAHISNKGLDTAAYNASKASIVQMCRSLAAEFGNREGIPQIRVNSISPGYVKSKLLFNDMLIDGREELWSSQNMLNRLSYPDEYRGPAVFLLSDASSFVTGTDLRVDGGHTAW